MICDIAVSFAFSALLVIMFISHNTLLLLCFLLCLFLNCTSLILWNQYLAVRWRDIARKRSDGWPLLVLITSASGRFWSFGSFLTADITFSLRWEDKAGLHSHLYHRSEALTPALHLSALVPASWPRPGLLQHHGWWVSIAWLADAWTCHHRSVACHPATT